jgi:hypothetical protein
MRLFQIRRLAKKGEEMLTVARVSITGDEVTVQMWTPAVLWWLLAPMKGWTSYGMARGV